MKRLFSILIFLFLVACVAPQGQIEYISENDLELKQGLSWLWGEVSEVDYRNSEFVLDYKNYEAKKQEKEIFKVDDNTVYRNIHSFQELRKGDFLSVDYFSEAQGLKASLIIVEKD